MEGKEWVWDNGVLKERDIEELKILLDKKKGIREDVAITAFESFFSKL
jgi:hypothetical protein